MNYIYKIHRDIYRDAWNWWDACNRISHGLDWSKKVDVEVIKYIKDKNEKEAYTFLIPFLNKKYTAEKDLLDKNKRFILKQFDHKFENGCNKIIETIGKPLYRTDFHFYLTTFRRCPYNKEKGLIWLCTYWKDPMLTFLHELCHFQFIHYWREDSHSEVVKLSNDQFEFLKESLTIILDLDFLPIIEKIDDGYELHEDFRKELTMFWKENKDFNKLVEFGTEKVTNYI